LSEEKGWQEALVLFQTQADDLHGGLISVATVFTHAYKMNSYAGFVESVEGTAGRYCSSGGRDIRDQRWGLWREQYC
jgi:hypothetical protein